MVRSDVKCEKNTEHEENLRLNTESNQTKIPGHTKEV